MSEEKKDIEREDSNSLDSDEDPNITSETGYLADRSISNHSISSLTDSKQNFVEYVANGLEIKASDVMIIEELSEVMGHENSDGKEPKITYEYPSDPDEGGGNRVPQAYFYNTDLCQEISNSNVSSLPQNSITMTKENENEIHEVPKEEERPDSPSNKLEIQDPCTQIYEIEIKEERVASQRNLFDTKYVEYGSDEFADVEDNIRDSLSDNSESYCGLQTVSPVKFLNESFPNKRTKEGQKNETEDNTRDSLSDNSESSCGLQTVFPVKFLNESFPNKITKEGQKNETREENLLLNKCKMPSYSSLMTEIANRSKEETSNVRQVRCAKSGQAEASCSYSLPNFSKLPDTFSVLTAPEESEKNNKCSLPTIVEESEVENNILKDNQPPRAKANPLKMKAKVGIRKDRCNVCRVRLGLCAIKCRCGGYYCAKHRYDKEHNCPFDYRTMGAEEIRKNNPKVIAEKVRKL